ncbi:MAG: DoxX family protein [Candidatus Eiseniibacteriota bacterium]
MSGESIVQRFFAPSPRLQDAGLLLIRLGFGLSLLLGHGIRKLPPSPRFVEGAANMGFPVPIFFAWAAALSETAGATLLALGLFTRPASLFVACTVGTAFFVRHAADPFNKKELALAYFLVALALLIGGPGRYSLDRWISDRTRPRS